MKSLFLSFSFVRILDGSELVFSCLTGSALGTGFADREGLLVPMV